MQVSLSDTGGLSRRLEVAVPATEVAREVQQRLKRLSRTARLKGFRPGKAPLAVITKQFGEQVRAAVLSDLVRSSFAQAGRAPGDGGPARRRCPSRSCPLPVAREESRSRWGRRRISSTPPTSRC